MTLPTRFILVIGGLIYFILPIIIWINKDKKLIRILVDILFGVYLVVLILGVTCRINFDHVSTIVDFDYSGEWLSKKVNWSLKEIVGADLIINLVMLIPIGLYVAFMSKNTNYVSFIVMFIIGFMLGLGIEILQYVLPVPRSVQVSDIILNGFSVCIGGLMGGILNLITTFFRKKE